MRLIMIHGVAQGGAAGEPAVIEAAWTAAMTEGGVRPAALAAVERKFAWYGNLLDAAGIEASTLASFAEDQVKAKFVLRTAAEVNAASGMLLARALNAAVIDPFSEATDRIVARAAAGHQPLSLGTVLEGLGDVFQYLTDRTLRDRIDNKVGEYLAGGPQTIVAHSLGSVIAYRLLRDRKIACRRLITIGSPLVFASVRNLLDGPFGWPKNLAEWRNFYDPEDAICLGLPFPPHPSWASRIVQTKVDKVPNHGHDALGYLAELPVGAAIDAML